MSDAEIKAQNQDLWDKAGYSVHADERPKAECCIPIMGHGPDCPLGQAPPKHEPPKGLLVFLCMSPIANYLADYDQANKGANDMDGEDTTDD